MFQRISMIYKTKLDDLDVDKLKTVPIDSEKIR